MFENDCCSQFLDERLLRYYILPPRGITRSANKNKRNTYIPSAGLYGYPHNIRYVPRAAWSRPVCDTRMNMVYTTDIAHNISSAPSAPRAPVGWSATECPRSTATTLYYTLQRYTVHACIHGPCSSTTAARPPVTANPPAAATASRSLSLRLF